jgi:O-antigen ligase
MKSLYPTLVADPHNLYLATAVQAGIVGLISFAIYLATLIIAAVSAQGAARRFGLAYIALIIVQGLSESFTFTSAFTAPTYWALIVLMRLMAVADAERRRTGVTS